MEWACAHRTWDCQTHQICVCSVPRLHTWVVLFPLSSSSGVYVIICLLMGGVQCMALLQFVTRGAHKHRFQTVAKITFFFLFLCFLKWFCFCASDSLYVTLLGYKEEGKKLFDTLMILYLLNIKDRVLLAYTRWARRDLVL